MLDRKGMEELSAWIFSTDQEDYVEQRIRLILMEDSRINSQSDWKSFAEHVLGPVHMRVGYPGCLSRDMFQILYLLD